MQVENAMSRQLLAVIGPRLPHRYRFGTALFLTSFALPAAAQLARQPMAHMHHTAWDEAAGLPPSGVVKLARSTDGYLWLGSASGLLRFDGVRFAVLDGNDVEALRSTVDGPSWPLLVDGTGILWISRPDGALVHYRNGEFWVAVEPDPKRLRIFRIVEDGLGRVWLAGGGALHTWGSGRLRPPSLPPTVPDTGILGVVPDTGKGVWIGTRTQGLWHVSTQHLRHYPTPSSPTDPGVRPLLQSRDGTLWVWGDRLQTLHHDRWSRPTLPGQQVAGIPAPSVAEARDGSIWIATRGYGVLRWSNGDLEQFTEADGLSDASVEELLLDTEDNLWVTTDAGLDRFRPAPFATVDRRDGLPFDSPLLVYGDADGSLWAMANGDSKVYQLDGGLIRGRPGKVTAQVVPLINGETGIPLAPSHGGGMWFIGRNSDKILRYRKGVVSHLPTDPQLVGKSARQGLEDRAGNLWLSIYPHGFGRLRDGRFKFISLPGAGDTPFVMSMVEDAKGHVWVALGDEPFVYELDGDSVVRRVDAASGLHQRLTALALEGGDTLWAVGESGVLVRLTSGNPASIHVSGLTGALLAQSAALIPQGDDLWVASHAGVARLPLKPLHAAADEGYIALEPRFFTALDGLAVAKMTGHNQHPAFGAHDGRIWFATPGGLAVVDPAAQPENQIPPQVHIEEVMAPEGIFRPGSDLSLKPNPDRIEIRYNATSLRVPERVRIEYQLEGSDQSWVTSGPTRTATYTQLRPGRYRFLVRAWNEDGVPSMNEAALSFRVLPMWHQTFWFAALVFIAVATAGATVVYAAQRARTRRTAERMRARFEATLVERTRLARELHDTLLQGFTGITLQLQAVHHSVEEASPETAASLARVLLIADSTLRDARQMVWDMRAPELDEQDLAEALEGAARRAVEGSAIDLHFVVGGDRRRLMLGVETAVLRIGREAVVNAVKHGDPRNVAVSLVFEPRRVGLSVRDDGRGFDPSRADAAVQTGHWGLRGMRERAARAGGKVEISGAPGRGTLVSLYLPVEDI